MILEILSMMEERRLAKRNMQKYNQIHCKIRETKNSWLARQCRETEALHVKHDAFHFQEIKRDYQHVQEDKHLKE